MAEQINVLVVEPGYAPYEKTIPDDYRAMQEIVGGLITAIYPYEEPVAIVANDEGILLGMDFNRSVEGGYGGIFGPFFVCGLMEDNFCSLTVFVNEKVVQKSTKKLSSQHQLVSCGHEQVGKLAPKRETFGAHCDSMFTKVTPKCKTFCAQRGKIKDRRCTS